MIVEIEKQCATEIEKAEADSKSAIEAHRKALEEKKVREFDLIAAEAQEKLQKAVEESKRASEEKLEYVRNDLKIFLENQDINREIEERIVSTILSD